MWVAKELRFLLMTRTEKVTGAIFGSQMDTCKAGRREEEDVCLLLRVINSLTRGGDCGGLASVIGSSHCIIDTDSKLCRTINFKLTLIGATRYGYRCLKWLHCIHLTCNA